MKPIYLPNLDPLRFFAATTVVFSHVDAYLWMNGYATKMHYFFPFSHGTLAVIFFFVLSGFLITYLLLIEKREFKDIAIKTFYLKRILRIWPLYFIVLISAFSYFNKSNLFHWKGITDNILMTNHLTLNIIAILCVSPNIALINTSILGYATPLWSIGVEEQFYLIWPWIINRKNSLLIVFFLITIIYMLNNHLIESSFNIVMAEKEVKIDSSIYRFLLKIDKFFTFRFAFHIDSMAIGALGAYLVVKKSSLLSIVYTKKMQLFLYIILVIILLVPSFSYQFISVIFMLIIINLSCNINTLFTIRSTLLNKLGRVSFGIYVYHCIMIPVCAKFILNFFHYSFISELLICFATLISTLIVSVISFNTIERIFLRLRPEKIINKNEFALN